MDRKIFYIVAFVLAVATLQVNAVGVLDGKVIALDAGHGGTETGAIGYCGDVAVVEADVNEAVRTELAKLIGDGSVYLIERLASRSDRVADAEANNANVLISIHHNGSSNTSADYTQSFVTQRNDKEFAKPIHARLASTFGPDRGIKNDGYGMTVYGSLPGVLTESYFITNTNNACDFLRYKADPADKTTKVHLEAEAMYAGLIEYFSFVDSGGGKGGGKPDKCDTWPNC